MWPRGSSGEPRDRFSAGKSDGMTGMGRTAKTRPISGFRPGLRRRATSDSFAFDVRETARIALPIVLAQVGQVVMMTTDLAFIGQISADALAAAALAVVF